VRHPRGETLEEYAQGIGSLIERLEVRFIFHFSRVFNKIIFESILKPKTNTKAHQSGKKLASNFFFLNETQSCIKDPCVSFGKFEY
jgi:hypothetical protein